MNITLENYHEKIVVADNSCWIYAGWIDPKLGYGHVYWNRKRDMAHRVFYQLFKGEIPSGLDIDHLCSIRSCVNPDHLRAVTTAENTLAPHSKSCSAINLRKVLCKRGHPLSGDNIFIYRGQRICRTCRKSVAHERYMKKIAGKIKLPPKPRALLINCRRGHPYAIHGRIWTNGKRVCWLCSYGKSREWLLNKRSNKTA